MKLRYVISCVYANARIFSKYFGVNCVIAFFARLFHIRTEENILYLQECLASIRTKHSSIVISNCQLQGEAKQTRETKKKKKKIVIFHIFSLLTSI